MRRHELGLALLVSSLRGQHRQIGGLVFWSLVQAVPMFLSGRLVATALDEGFLAHRPAMGFAWLALLGACVLAGAWATARAFSRLAALVEPFRDELAELAVVGALRPSTAVGADCDRAGVARMTQHVEIAREAYGSALMVIQGFLVTGVSALLGLLSVIPSALVLVLPPLLLGLALFFGTLSRMEAAQRTAVLDDERLVEAATTAAVGLRDITACGGEEIVAASVGARIDARSRSTERLARLAALCTLAVALGGWLPVVLLLVGTPWLLREGATTGAVLGALTYVLHGVHPALQMLVREIGNSGLWLLTTLDRLAEAAPDGRAGGSDLVAPSQGGHHPPRYDVLLRNVTFRYGPRADPVIEDLELHIPEGDHLAIVGPSGIGKSTVAALIAGVLAPQRGEVLCGGVSVLSLDPSVRARLRVLIPQEAYVFDGTTWENLTYLAPGTSVREVDRTIDRLGMRSLIDRIGGYEAPIDLAVLSAGERQLITLARAYLSPAPITLLDEATCHLDPRAEELVERAFSQRSGTLIVVAHRISSARRARRVAVMDGTQLTVGAQAEVLVNSSLYRDFVGYWL
jgi:ABC-type multidrug transport system fused ATPase/permease subunit